VLAGRHEAWAVQLLGEIAGHGEPQGAEQAKDDYQKTLTLADELGMRSLQVHCHRGLGTLYDKISRPDKARAELTAATELYRALEMTFRLTRAASALVQLR
jgi:hypothetical protein